MLLLLRWLLLLLLLPAPQLPWPVARTKPQTLKSFPADTKPRSDDLRSPHPQLKGSGSVVHTWFGFIG